MAPSLGRFYFTRATCVTGWMMRLQRGTDWEREQLAYTSVEGCWNTACTQNGSQLAYLDACWNVPWYSERRATRVPRRRLKYTMVFRTERNLGTWTEAEMYYSIQDGAQLGYLGGRWNIPWYSGRRATWVPGRTLKYRGTQGGAQLGYLDGC